jgi:hypothetical protein
MKSTIKLSLVALAAAVSGAVFTPAAQAQAPVLSGEQLSAPDYSHLKSLRSRAEVRAEAVAANRARSTWSGEYPASFASADLFVSTKTRQQVATETLEAIRLGQVSYSGEHGPAVSSHEPLASATNRLAAVRAEVSRQ